MKLLILGAGVFQQPVIRRAKELGHVTVVADLNPAAPGLVDADIPVIVSSTDTDSLLSLARGHEVVGVLTTSDYPVKTVAALCRKLGLLGLSQESADICTNKFRQRQVLSGAGLKTPKFCLISSSDEIRWNFDFPVIIKPIDSSASRGVSKVCSEPEMSEAIALARSFSRNGQVIIEEYLDGPEYSVEVLVQEHIHVIAITQKITAGESSKYFVEECHVVPAHLSVDAEGAILDLVKAAISAIGINHAACHIEVMLTNKGPIIIEIAARLGGDYITSHLVPLATGVDMLSGVINIALGIPAATKSIMKRYAGIRFLTPDNYIKTSPKLESLINDEHLIAFERAPLEFENKLKNSLDRLGYWIYCADNRDSLVEKLKY